jgi:carbonic anhydrase
MIYFFLLYQVNACEFFNYTTGADWEGSCDLGLQSPISIEESFSIKHYLFNSYPAYTNLVAENCESYYKIPVSKGKLYTKDQSGATLVSSLTKLEFHAPSEHQLKNLTYDLELELVHTVQSESSFKTIILSLFFNSSLPDPGFFSQIISNDSLLDSIPSFSLSSLIDSSFIYSKYYVYQGSLSTPPCSPQVLWYLVDHEFGISPENLKVFTDKWAGNLTFAGGNGNNRPIQALNDRIVQYNS